MRPACHTGVLLLVTLLLLAAAPEKPRLVTVVKTDGATVRGQLNSIDPKGVTVQPTVRNLRRARRAERIASS